MLLEVLASDEKEGSSWRRQAEAPELRETCVDKSSITRLKAYRGRNGEQNVKIYA